MDNKYEKYFIKPDLKKSKKRTRNQSDVIYANIEVDENIVKMAKDGKYYIRTYGCQMNVHDTEVMQGILENIGYKKTETIEEADIIIFNTCAIRENAENKVFGEIGRVKNLKLENPDKIFAICGCMSQEESVVDRILKTYSFIDIIFGTHNIHRLPELLKNAIYDKEKVIEVWSQEGEVIENLPKRRDNNFKAWVNIIYGCDKFCTYCIVPYTRGKERSRNPEDILMEIDELIKDGYKEITLLGQNVNAYGKDLNINYTMSNLLEDIALKGIPRLRFVTSHPWDFEDDMIDVIAKYDNILPNIHLPVQSGNNAILKIMGRSYTKEKYLELFNKLKAKKPNITITTDIIVGYPNETEEQFEDTIKLYEECKFDGAFTFLYSQREGTPAAKMVDNVDTSVKKERLYRLNQVVNKYAKKSNEDMIGKVVSVLIEGTSRKTEGKVVGYSENNKLVIIDGNEDMIGNIYDVKIIDAKNTNLIGEVCH